VYPVVIDPLRFEFESVKRAALKELEGVPLRGYLQATALRARTRLAMADALVHFGQRERDLAYTLEFTRSHSGNPAASHWASQPICIASYSLTEPPLLRPGHPLAMTTAS
jgi:hypothetical protein